MGSSQFVRRASLGSQRPASSSSASSSSNPFARKRAANFILSSSQLSERSQPSQQPTKKIVLGARTGTSGTAMLERREFRPVATPVKKYEQPQLVKPDFHSRGGHAAKDAADAVLAQRGFGKLAPVAPNKDRTKLTGFFPHQQKLPEAPKEPPPKSALASWKARPWEEDDEVEESAAAYVNPLSMQGTRRPGGGFMTRGW